MLYINDMLNEIIKMIELSKNTKGQDWRHNINQIKIKINEYAKEYHESKEVYVVIAYRWGDRANYSYTLGAFDTKDAAVKCAESHVNFRGGKYDCVVEKCILNQFENNWDNYTEEIHWAKAKRTRCFMSILDRIRSIEFDRNRKKVLGIKSAVLWAHSKDNNGSYPLNKRIR